jgi:hypothetical protein
MNYETKRILMSRRLFGFSGLALRCVFQLPRGSNLVGNYIIKATRCRARVCVCVFASISVPTSLNVREHKIEWPPDTTHTLPISSKPTILQPTTAIELDLLCTTRLRPRSLSRDTCLRWAMVHQGASSSRLPAMPLTHHYARYLNCRHFKVPRKATKLPVIPFQGRMKSATLSGIEKSFSW